MNSTNMAMALWFIKQFNSHFWSARIILIVVNLSEVTRNILFNIQNLVFWKPMVNTLLYVKYSLGPGDETISETCCRLAQTKIKPYEQIQIYEPMTNWTGDAHLAWPQDQCWEKTYQHSPPNILLIMEYLHLNSPICTKAY